MPRSQPYLSFVTFLGVLIFSALACNMPGSRPDPSLNDIPAPQEHVSEEQLQDTIKKTQEAYFSEDFNGQRTYGSQDSANQFNKPECDSDFPQGSNIIIKQHFYAGDGDLDRVALWIDGETRIYENSGNPYEFCRESHTRILQEGDEGYGESSINEIRYHECLTFRDGGFDLSVGYRNPSDRKWVECYWDKYSPTEAAAAEYQAYNGQWTSSEDCGDEAEFPYTWTVALTTDDTGKITGTIRFHDCGGGNMVYAVRGQVDIRDPSGVYLSGDLISGAGDLFDKAPIDPMFYYEIGKPPEPNLSK